MKRIILGSLLGLLALLALLLARQTSRGGSSEPITNNTSSNGTSLDADSCLKRLATINFIDYALCFSYPVETHVITTGDGYKLTLFRIQAKNTKITPGKRVVLMWHGLLDSADSWIMNEENLAPGLILANKGYDIWFGNSRGNKYSLDHTSLDHNTSVDYWSFSWMHMSENDLAAAFSYITGLTNEKINYIGHSQGTTQMFAHLANPSGKNSVITANLRKFAALGPVTYMANVKTKLMLLLANTPLLPEILAKVGKFGIFNSDWVTSETGRILCTYMPWACKLTIELTADVDSSADNLNRLDILGGHFPSGTSVTNLMHWKQEVQQAGRFQKYDYGKDGNQKLYGQDTPPRYNPALITEDVAMFVGTDDLLATSYDASKWYGEMVNTKNKEIHYYPIGHLTFLIGKETVYMDDLIKFLDLENKNQSFLTLDD